MNELRDNHELGLEEQKLRLTNLIAELVNNGQIAAVDLDGGKFLDAERRKKIEAQIQLIKRENFPGVNLLRDLQFEVLSSVTAPFRRIQWEIKKRSISDTKEKLAAAVQFDMGGPHRVRYGKEYGDHLQSLLGKEEATIALVDRSVMPEEIKLGMGIKSVPAHNLYVQTANANLSGGVVELDGTYHQSDTLDRANIMLIAGLKGNYITDSKAASDYLRQNIGVLLNLPSVYVKFSGRGFEKSFEGFGKGEELKMKNPRAFKDINLPSEQIRPTIDLMSTLMKT